ncbi:shTK domain protein [Dictyocaulus viviparus]|uniref:ShTK domain protein n=1 Tax=Dictyocaulus viviparus TaxID=29172 RepID=A0A0D8X7T3_DICVI|nr:shTK domain protein [Dictyocaulus viviparus]
MCINDGMDEICCENSLQRQRRKIKSKEDFSACTDLLNPITLVSDCPARAHLCNDALYFKTMTKQCPKTCNRCPGTPGATIPPPEVSGCRDFVSPITGVSDCPQRSNYCTHPLYRSVMIMQCSKTCGFCT